MKTEEFESVCESLYAMTPNQRERLGELLASRLWYYEAEPELTFEQLHELDAAAWNRLLAEIDLAMLATSSKGISRSALDRIKGILSSEDCATFDSEWRALGPTRLSVVERAQAEIFGILDRLCKNSEITLAPIHRLRATPESGGRTGPLYVIQRPPWYWLFALADYEIRALISDLQPELLAEMLAFADDNRLTRKFLLNSPSAIGEQVLKALTTRKMVPTDNDEVMYGRGRRALDEVFECDNQKMDECEFQRL